MPGYGSINATWAAERTDRLALERDAAVATAKVTTEALRAERHRAQVLQQWLLTLPDEHISDQARRDGLAILAGEPEPGRDPR